MALRKEIPIAMVHIFAELIIECQLHGSQSPTFIEQSLADAMIGVQVLGRNTDDIGHIGLMKQSIVDVVVRGRDHFVVEHFLPHIFRIVAGFDRDEIRIAFFVRKLIEPIGPVRDFRLSPARWRKIPPFFVGWFCTGHNRGLFAASLVLGWSGCIDAGHFRLIDAGGMHFRCSGNLNAPLDRLLLRNCALLERFGTSKHHVLIGSGDIRCF